MFKIKYILQEEEVGSTPEVGGMIAINPLLKTDRWYVAKAFFEENYEEVIEEKREQNV